MKAYFSGLIDAGFPGLSKLPLSDGTTQTLPYRGYVQDHIRLLGKSSMGLEKLAESPTTQKVASPTMLHADFEKTNIYVSEEDPSSVTGIIDWQFTCIEPAVMYANMTRFP